MKKYTDNITKLYENSVNEAASNTITLVVGTFDGNKFAYTFVGNPKDAEKAIISKLSETFDDPKLEDVEMYTVPTTPGLTNHYIE